MVQPFVSPLQTNERWRRSTIVEKTEHGTHLYCHGISFVCNGQAKGWDDSSKQPGTTFCKSITNERTNRGDGLRSWLAHATHLYCTDCDGILHDDGVAVQRGGCRGVEMFPSFGWFAPYMSSINQSIRNAVRTHESWTIKVMDKVIMTVGSCTAPQVSE